MRIYDQAYRLTTNMYFQIFLFMTVISNLLVQLLDSYPLNLSFINSSELLNAFFTLIVVFEVIVKCLAFGMLPYLKSSVQNKFDIFIATVSVMDVLIIGYSFYSDRDAIFNSALITGIKFFRIIRIFKIARYWTRFQLLLETLYLTAIRTVTFALLVLFIMLSYTLVGQELFSGGAKFNPSNNKIDLENGVSPVFNFDNFLNSFVSVSMVLTNDS